MFYKSFFHIFKYFIFLIVFFLNIGLLSAYADTLVNIKSSHAILNKPSGSISGSVILMAGSHGRLNISADGRIRSLRGNQLIRTRKKYARAGVASLAVDSGVNLSAAIQYMRKIAKPVVVVGTSRAATRMHRAISAKPNGLVLISAMLDVFQSNVGSPSRLPRTLVVHHRADECHVTLPSLVKPFKKWGGSRVQVKWVTGGCSSGRACKARSHHGFNCQDSKVVSIVASFVRSLR